jgi:hypothetical protein
MYLSPISPFHFQSLLSVRPVVSPLPSI